MVSNAILIGITVGVFFAGIGVSYTIFSSTYDPNTMKFADQDLFDQMMSNNPKMTAQWMESTIQDSQSNQQMMEQMNDMMNDPKLQQQMIDLMKNMMGTMDDQMMNDMDSAMAFNPDVPITLPMIDGYYNGKEVFFIHTEFSTLDMANMATMMINFPTLHASELQDISSEETGKIYAFTNGVPGSGPYGGGPFFFQIDIFDSIPGQEEYSQFRVIHLVAWNDDSTPRILTSLDELLQAQSNGEVSIEKTDLLVNAPMIVWDSGTKKQAEHIETPFITMPKFDAQVVNIDEDNYSVTLQFSPIDSGTQMNMMN